MTLIAEINPSSFPVDDAAIVSTLSKIELGYQLDATVDRGPRTIGFKLADNSGRLMARYGRTPLRTDNWYHVAGVYDAELQTLDVYLDGRKDNGCLLGTVTARQHISGAEVYVGRRADLTGFEFPGSIDDVKIYSMALTPGQIETDMEMRRAARSEALPLGSRVREEPIPNSDGSGGTCASSQMPDASSAGFVVVCGFLVALASAGLWPNAPSRMACLTVSIAAGFLLIPSADPALQPFYPWMVPLLTLMGGATVAASLRPCTVLAHENH
jgi:hypothetical protein